MALIVLLDDILKIKKKCSDITDSGENHPLRARTVYVHPALP